MEWSFDAVVEWFESDSAQAVLRALLGLLVLVAGWPVARLLSAASFWLARRIARSPRLASLAGLPAPEAPAAGDPAEHRGAAMVGRIVFVLVMCAAFVAGLYVSDLAAVSEPLARFTIAIEDALPFVGRAAVILLISYVAARMLRRGVTVGLSRLRVDDRLAAARPPAPPDGAAPPPAAQPERAFSEQVGLVTYWLVLAFGLAATVESLEFVPLSSPIRDGLDRIIALLPALGSALIILAGGGLLAWLTRRVVKSLLESAGFDRLVRRIDVGRTLERVSPSALVGLAAMLFVLAEAVIAALDQLNLTGLSAPMTAALTDVGAALPDVGLGLLILVVGHIAGRIARRWVERLADELRLDAVLERIGVLRDPGAGAELSTSSRVLGVAAYLVVMMVAAQQAFAAAGLSVWAGHVSALLAFSIERVGIAALIVLVGFALGTQARNQVIARGLGGPETTAWIGGAARIMVLVFAFTMAIHHLGVAERFVTMAFGFAFGGLCLALALAFGLGGREITAELLRRRLAELTEAKRRADGEPPEGAP